MPTTTVHGPSPSPLAKLRGFLHRAEARAAERRSLAQLCRLDERLLRDVGLTRDDVTQLTGGHC